MTSSSLSLFSFITAWPNLRSSRPAASPAHQIHHDFSLKCSLFDTRLFALISLFGISPAVGTALVLACCWHVSFLACCWHCSFLHGSSGPIPGCFFCPSRPSVPCSSVHISQHCCILLLLPLSWLTDSLFTFLSSYAATFRLLFSAPGTRCRLHLLLLSRRFFVSAHARPRARRLLLT